MTLYFVSFVCCLLRIWEVKKMGGFFIESAKQKAIKFFILLPEYSPTSRVQLFFQDLP